MTRRDRRRARRSEKRRERGAALVEAAIIIPLLLMLAFGVVDFGMLHRHSLSQNVAVRAGARVGSNAGNSADADWQIVNAVLNGRSTIDETEVLRLVVYKADSADGKPPPECVTRPPLAPTPQSGLCNVFDPVDFARRGNKALFLGSGVASYWPATSRLSSAFVETDYLGVWMLTRFDYVTGAFGDSRRVTDNAVYKIDPSTGDLGTSVVTLPPPPRVTTTTTTTAPPTTTTASTSTTTTIAPTTTTTASTTTTTTTPGATTSSTVKPTTTTTSTTVKPTTTTASTTTTTRPLATTTTFNRGNG